MSNFRHRLEVGAQRLYYVLWGIAGPLFLFAVIQQEQDSLPKVGWESNLFWAGVIATVTLGPWVAMVLFKWVYRGFFPKT